MVGVACVVSTLALYVVVSGGPESVVLRLLPPAFLATAVAARGSRSGYKLDCVL